MRIGNETGNEVYMNCCNDQQLPRLQRVMKFAWPIQKGKTWPSEVFKHTRIPSSIYFGTCTFCAIFYLLRGWVWGLFVPLSLFFMQEPCGSLNMSEDQLGEESLSASCHWRLLAFLCQFLFFIYFFSADCHLMRWAQMFFIKIMI